MSKDRQKSEISRDRRNIAALYLRGKTQVEIAAELQISQATVSRDLAAIRGEWVKESVQAIDQRKAIELAKIDALELEYWEAWKRSQVATKQEVSEVFGTGVGNKAKIQKRTTEQTGDPRFLSGVMQCIEKRCQILGIGVSDKKGGVSVNVGSGIGKLEGDSNVVRIIVHDNDDEAESKNDEDSGA